MAIVENSRIKLTYEDYLIFPDDGKRHEIVDGEHVVTPSPKSYHQALVGRIFAQLLRQIEESGRGRVFVSPMDVRLSTVDVVQPDILAVLTARAHIIEESFIRGAPDLVVEVLSESTAERDRGTKKARYERLGVTEYWVIDPVAKEAEQFVLDAEKKGYVSRGAFRNELVAEILPEVRVDVARVW